MQAAADALLADDEAADEAAAPGGGGAALAAAAAARQSDDGAPERYAVPDDDADSRAFALAMAQVADAVKGTDLLLLHVAPIVYWTRYMLFVTVFSRPQVCGPRGEA